MRSFFEEVFKIKKKLSQQTRRTVALASLCPLLSMMIVFAPDRLILNYAMMGIGGGFLSPLLFILINSAVCFIAGIGFFSPSSCGRAGHTQADEYNGRLLMLTALFFLHVWIFLFICSAEMLVSIVSVALALLFSVMSLICFFKVGRIGLFSALSVCAWTVSLLLITVRVLFI